MTVINVNQDNTEFNVRNVETEITIQSIGLKGVDGVGVPAGGGTGQVLAKNSSTDYDTEWVDVVPDAVSSVNGQTGVVVLDAADIGADAAGSASNALSQANDYTDEQIGDLATVASTGSYNDLLNKPTIPTVPVTSVNGEVGDVVLTSDDVADTASNRYTNDSDITRLANTSGTNTGDQDLSSYATTTSVTSGLALKANLASPTFTGTVGGITKSMVGLGNVDNTSDASKNSAVATLSNKTIDGGTY